MVTNIEKKINCCKDIYLAFFFQFLLCTAADAKQYTLFEDGVSAFSIVVSSDASESEKYAATELQKFIKECGGAELCIVDAGEGENGHRVILGLNAESKALLGNGYRPQRDDDDSFCYLNFKGDIVIIGGRDRGTLYGVYSFLEEELGCRWYSMKCYYCPKTPIYRFKKLKHYEKPGTLIRNMLYAELGSNDFKTKCRLNGKYIHGLSSVDNQIGGNERYYSVHTIGQFVPADRYFDEHPEYFALVEGKRSGENAQLCLSNPQVFEICLREMRNVMRQRPDCTIFDLSTNDNTNYCECPECAILFNDSRNFTDVVMSFVNRVADSLRTEFPEKKIGFLAYRNTRMPPLVERPHSNVVVRLCDIECCFMHPLEASDCDNNVSFMNDLKKWSEITDRLYIWDYVVDFALMQMPFPNFGVLQKNIQTFNEFGAYGIMEQGNNKCTKGEFADLRVYVLSKLLWNPNADVKAIVDDFITRYYGEAAPFVRRYFDLLQSQTEQGKHWGVYGRYYDKFFDDSFIRAAFSIFNEAESLKLDQAMLERWNLVKLPVNVLYCMREPQKAVSNGVYTWTKAFIEQEEIELGAFTTNERLYERIKPFLLIEGVKSF